MLVISASAQTFTTLHAFEGTDGVGPSFMSFVQGFNGTFYGITSGGGDMACNPPGGCGTVFRLNASGSLKTLHVFEGADGMGPEAGLIVGTDKSLYGTTTSGGDLNCNPPIGCGTVFRITPDGTLTTLHAFELTDGAFPMASLLQASDGNFYGTTLGGGPNSDSGGTIFKLSRDGTLNVLFSFCLSPTCHTGYEPTAPLIEGIDGKLYGTTSAGGTNACYGQGCGTVFRVTSSGRLTTLHRFGHLEGLMPRAGLVQTNDGTLFGTTVGGGLANAGTVFRIDQTGNFSTLYTFSGKQDGAEPYAPLVLGTDASLYGTTSAGDLNSAGGTIFKITPSGALTTLYAFCTQPDCIDGNNSFNGLLQGTNGKFYGATTRGGVFDDGTLFSLDTGLEAFVHLPRNFGKAGGETGILGQGFTGATNVSFNGIATDFSVVSDTFIKATVPVGATTGYVTVTTPNGPLSSDTPFYVR